MGRMPMPMRPGPGASRKQWDEYWRLLHESHARARRLNSLIVLMAMMFVLTVMLCLGFYVRSHIR